MKTTYEEMEFKVKNWQKTVALIEPEHDDEDYRIWCKITQELEMILGIIEKHDPAFDQALTDALDEAKELTQDLWTNLLLKGAGQS